MYEEFFGFQKRPFAAAPRVDHYFPAESIDTARRTLSRCVERSEGVGLLIGPTGTGKSLLCQMLAERFKSSHDVVLLCSGRLCTRRALLQAILFELGLPFRGLEEGELRLSIVDFLNPDKTHAKGMLLMVDEAHTLPLRLLEELRMIANLVRRGESRVQLILAGGPALEDRFASPKLEALAQRVSGRCYLEPLARDETRRYVRQELSLVGARGDAPAEPIFASEAMRNIHRATDGIVRLINQLCDHALILAHADGQRAIDADGVDQAWADLQQLPMPADTSADEESGGSSIIEFGGLDDEPELSTTSVETSGVEVSAATEADAVADAEADPRSIVTGARETQARAPHLGLATTGDPAAQIDEIQQQLGAIEDGIEDEFRPAGTIGPEVELVFPEHGHPFEERFDDEEVVLDRHVSLVDRQRVSGQQSRDLSEALAQFVEQLSDGQLAVLPMPEATPEAVEQRPASPATDPVLPDLAETSHQPAGEADVSIVAETNDESAELVVEEEPDGVAAVSAYRMVPVTRPEYRQLFAKLRRG